MTDEQRVIGAVIQAGGEHVIRPEWFQKPENRQLATSIVRLKSAGTPIDIDTVVNDSGIEFGEVARIVSNAIPANIDFHIGRLHEESLRADLLKQLKRGDPVQTVIDQALADLGSAPNQSETIPITTCSELYAMTFKDPKWAIPGILPEGVTLLAGKPKMGKSWMALSLGIAVSLGGNALSYTSVSKGEVLYLALEDNLRRLKKRMEILLHGEPGSARLHLATEWPRIGDGGLRELRTWLESHPEARLVIIDTLARLKPPRRQRDAYDADYSIGKVLKTLADEFSVAIMVVHHLRKMVSDDDVMDQISGTLGLTGGTDGAIVLDRKRGERDAVLHVTGRDIEEELSLALHWEQESATWAVTGNAIKASTDERQIVINLLRDGEAWSPEMIAKETGDRLNTVQKLLKRMHNDGEISRTGKANQGYRYRL